MNGSADTTGIDGKERMDRFVAKAKNGQAMLLIRQQDGRIWLQAPFEPALPVEEETLFSLLDRVYRDDLGDLKCAN